ncbi:uncharacterized protein KIAA0754-like [Setaria italica]|uniref:uncharacterized protein KIAA0754-like n=1 Tax=Setaria italica TaxID=4555 RepID=UPI000350902C|nr:uncharacterized protein KIAA0754-like [Setaria italica]
MEKTPYLATGDDDAVQLPQHRRQGSADVGKSALQHLPLAPLQDVIQRTGLVETRVEAALAAPDAAIPDAAVEVGTTAPEGVGLTYGPGACTSAPVKVGAVVADANARSDPSVAATASATAAGAGVPVAAASFVPAPIVASGAGTSAPAAAAASTAAPQVDVPASVAAAVAGAGVSASSAAAVPVAATGADSPSSVSTAVPATAAGATAPVSATAVGPARSSSASSSSRSITTLVGGPPGAMLCTAGSAEEAKGGAGVVPCLVPGCGSTPPVVAAGATSAAGSTVSLATPPLAADGVAVYPAEVEDTCAFFSTSDGTKSRGAAL